MKIRVCWSAIGFLLLTGCVSVGAETTDRDRLSKSHFTFMMVLFSLVEPGAAPHAPLITLQVN